MITDYISDAECNIRVRNGFLKNVCNTKYREFFKCTHSNIFYTETELKAYSEYEASYVIGLNYDQACNNDPYFYQMCGLEDTRPRDSGIFSNLTVCGDFICKRKKKIGSYWTGGRRSSVKPLQWLRNKRKLCNKVADCVNTNLDETGCEEIDNVNDEVSRYLVDHKDYQGRDICNKKLAIVKTPSEFFDNGYDEYFEDESNCSGYKYGLTCGYTYVPPYEICDGKSKCASHDDEDGCLIHDTTNFTCTHRKTGMNVPIFSYVRCAPFELDNEYRAFTYDTEINTFDLDYDADLEDLNSAVYFSYCQDFLDQTNCSDPDMVGMNCKVGGYLSSISRLKICQGTPVCDDGLDMECVVIPPTCSVHKHKLCDKTEDCQGGIDEAHPDCQSTTKKGCERLAGRKGKVLPLPLSWLHDGVEDCVDGSDEQDIWETCGVGETFRFVFDNSTCQNVLICLHGEPGFVEPQLLCDGRETCGNEQRMCDKSHRKMSLSNEVITTDYGLTKNLSFCLTGLSSLQKLASPCTYHDYIFPNQEIFGVEKPRIHLPNTKQNCHHLYGEDYVYTSCTNMCINSSCPLISIPKYESCPGQFNNRVGTLVNNEYITFFKKSFYNVYVNDFFVCKNKIKCIDYAQVCDLVDDCGDGSDEEHCTNHFKCGGNHYIPKVKFCDGVIDCPDLSDECNSKCTKEILDGRFLKGISWTVGISSVAANSIIILRTALSLRRSRTSVALINKSLILAIGIGDFFIGSYLVAISILDSAIFGKEYCSRQTYWLTSSGCSIIGILSTFGSQISLFSMAGLSLIRVNGIWNSMKIPGEVSPIKLLQILSGLAMMIAAALSIAVIPIIGSFEDFFANGLNYDPAIKVFMGFPGKEMHFGVLQEYYGRMKNKTLKWSQINNMVDKMFSHDPNHEDLLETRSKHDFYGNDGVCLFKYFVKTGDPQRKFVWAILSLNLVCFVFISLSYVIIGVLSYKSSQQVATAGDDRQTRKRTQRMNRKIAIIIGTDFLCWVPFIITCTLHSLEVTDATPWYALFSMVILPINSVINPLLYDDFLSSFLTKVIVRSSRNLSLSIRTFTSRADVTGNDSGRDDIAMSSVQVQNS